MPDGWRLRHLGREALRNVLGRGARMLPTVLLAVLLGSGAAAFLAMETDTLRADLEALAERGRGVVSYGAISPEQQLTITRESCEDLVTQPGVLAAGLLTAPEQRQVRPGAVEVMTRRASSTLFPQLAHTDAVIGSQIVDRAGTFRTRVSGSLLEAQTLPQQREGLAASHGVYLGLRHTDSDAGVCAVMLDHFADANEHAPTHLAMLDASGGHLSGTEVLQATTDPIEAFLDRPARFLPVLLGLLGAVATAISYRLRASELAVYRLSGTARSSMLQLMTLEIATIGGIAATSATAAALVLRDRFLDPAVPILWGLILAGTWSLVTLLASADLALRRPTDLAKDR